MKPVLVTMLLIALLVALLLAVIGSNQKIVVPPLPTPPPNVSQPKATIPAHNHNAVTQTVLAPIPSVSTQWQNGNLPMYQQMITKIVVSIPEQTLFAYHGSEVLRQIKVSTAAGPSLPPGEELESPHSHVGYFRVERKDPDHISGEFGSPMPFAMFYWRGHAIHATEPKFYNQLGTPASHGCVRTTLDDAKWLFERTALNTPVIIEGPLTNNKTPAKPTAKKRAGLTRAN
jgi:lipoprotein-anchoring transpeptidase ErfK/SrfK